MKNPLLKRRIIDISYRNKLSHVGSCITAVDLIAKAYEDMSPRDKFILSNGHAGLAQYVVIESRGGKNAEELFHKHGVHPSYCPEDGIWASTGSLGHGIGIAVGYALADRTKNVYVMVSDGEMAEGSVYESLNTASDMQLDNLKIIVNANGFSAMRKVYPHRLVSCTASYKNLNIRVHQTQFDFPFLDGLSAHYMTLNESQYNLAMEMTKC